MQDTKNKDIYEFCEFRLDIKKRRLSRAGEIVSLTPKEFDLLFFLVENAGRAVEKEELLEKIWRGTFVEEGTLTRNISWLRKKLSAAAGGETKFIETVAKFGYRFLPEVKSGERSLVIEEKTVRHIQIEEVIEFEPSGENGISFADGKIINLAPAKTLPAAPEKRGISPFWIVPAVAVFALAAFTAYRAMFAPRPPQVIIAPKIMPFSGLPGRETTPAFSPDGKQMVYAWDGGRENGNLDIYVKIIGAGEPFRLTDNAAEEVNPVFSPDGKSIAFVRALSAHNEIILIPALGGAERKIDERASYASVSFSPDGKNLAAANLDFSTGEAGIFLINLESGERRRLTMPAAPSVDHTPRFSPDGRFLAFIRYFSSFHREIFVIPMIDGGEPRQITDDDVRIYGLAWSADGQKLLFTSYRAVNRLNLWQIGLNGENPQMIPTGSRELPSVAVSSDGRTIAFVEETADENIWEIDGESKRPLIHSTRADHSQKYSPDGTKIVFASDRTGNYEIWLADADGKNQRQLTDSNGSAGSPRFSPDGKTIVFDAQIADRSDIYTISVNGGAPKKLSDAGEKNFLPAWSADGRWIFFISNRSGDEQLWKMPAGDGEAVQITKQGAFEAFAAPDGKTVIYSKGSAKHGLWQVDVSGADEKPIPELAGAGAWRSWFVAAGGIYYTEFSAQPPFRVKFFDFASRRIKEVAAVEKPPLLYYPNLSVSADGKKILYARQDQNAGAILLAELEK